MRKLILFIIVILLCATVMCGCFDNESGNSIKDITKNFPKDLCVISSSITTQIYNGNVLKDTVEYTYDKTAEFSNGIILINATATKSDGSTTAMKFAYTADGVLIAQREYINSGEDYAYCLEERSLEAWCNKDGFDHIEELDESDDCKKHKLYYKNGEYTICTVKDEFITAYKSYNSEGVISVSVESNQYNIDTKFCVNFDSDPVLELVIEREVQTQAFTLNESNKYTAKTADASTIRNEKMNALVESFIENVISENYDVALSFYDSSAMEALYHYYRKTDDSVGEWRSETKAELKNIRESLLNKYMLSIDFKDYNSIGGSEEIIAAREEAGMVFDNVYQVNGGYYFAILERDGCYYLCEDFIHVW